MGSSDLTWPTLQRLSEYLLVLEQALREGCETISSNELAKIYGNTASQVRQDLFRLPDTGRVGQGYRVKTLVATIREAMGLQHTTNVAIVGCGNLGAALAEHVEFSLYGMSLKGVYDKDSSIIGTVLGERRVEDVAGLSESTRSREIRIAALCVPPTAAQEVSDLLVAGQVRGILNYTRCKLKVPSTVIVQDRQVVCSFMQLAYISNLSGVKK